MKFIPPHIDKLLEKNRFNYNYIYSKLQNIDNITLLENKPDRKTAAWLFTMKILNKNIFITRMKEYNIMVSQVHNRNDINTCVRQFESELPNVEQLEKELICIPVGWWLTINELDYIVQKIIEINTDTNC